jgi:hypothetical protein
MEPVTDVFGTQTSAAAMAFGLRGVVDWSVQQPFLDVFKTARPWHAHTDSQWGAYLAEDLEAMNMLDANGWITDIPASVDRIETFILTEMPAEATYTSGLYRLSYDGAGDINIVGAEIVSRSTGEIWFDYRPDGDSMVTISISSTDPQNNGNYLRNIEVVKQEHIPAYEAGQLFNPLWLDVIDDAHALRFMDWQETNDSTLERWSDHPQVNDYTYHGGVPIEVMVDLANATGTDAWFNIPWNADETFIREFATYVRDNLNPDLRAHIELSNEVWNWMFDQAQDAAQASQVRFGQDLGDGWMQEYGARSAEMARILDQVYAGSEDQLVKVLATHTYWPGLENAMLYAPNWQAQSSANDAPFLSFDTYSITGYFGNSLGTDEKANAVLGWIGESAAQARQEASARGLTGSAADQYFAEHRFDLAEDLAIRELRDGSVTGNGEDSLQGLFELFRYHKSVADAHGLDLVMYEGGTHVIGIGQWVNNDTLTEFFTHLNYSEGMGQLYSELLAGWEAAGGTLFNAFVDVSEPSQWGSWGSLRHLEDSTARHDAVVDFMLTHPAPPHMKDGNWNSEPQDFGPPPTPVDEDRADQEADPQPEEDEQQDTDQVPNPDSTPLPNPNPSPATDSVIEYVFGNSLYVWAVGDPELSVAHWMNAMALAAGNSYSTSMQTGMLTQHDDLPARPHVSIEGVTEAWDPDSGPNFANAGFNQITISPANFVQDQSPDSPYWIDPNTSPLESALRIIDWADANAPRATINIYETWPEMEGFMSSFPPSTGEFTAWQNYLLGEWHSWWEALTDMIRDARPDIDVRLIDVGPQVMDMLNDANLGLSNVSVTDLFQDDAPHGTPTLYLLSSIIHYTTLFGETAPNSVQIPDSVHPVIADNYQAIASWIADRQNADLPPPIVDPFVETSDDRPDGPFDGGDDASEDRGTDVMTGSNGNDLIRGESGLRGIDGGNGVDTVALAGHQSSYTLILGADVIEIQRRSEPTDAATTLWNIERLDFEEELSIIGANGMDLRLFDGMADLDSTSMAALTELYIAYFNRAPDAVGLFFWGDQLAQGTNLDRIAEAFFDQPETRALYGSLNDMSGFVTAVYQNVLGRDPDSEGMTYWLDVLDSASSVTPATFIQAILAGAKSETGGPGDAEYLANKVTLGGHFAVTRGMSDVEDARNVMQGFDGSIASLQARIEESDTFYETALSSDNGGFLMQLLGINDAPFVF